MRIWPRRSDEAAEREAKPRVQAPQGVGDGFVIRASQVCDRGLARPNNEDSTLTLQLIRYAGDERMSLRLLAVADGMGGPERGEVASRLTLSVLATYLTDHLGDVPPSDSERHIEFLRGAMQAVNDRVYASQDPRVKEKMGTTLVFACALGPELFIGNVGDSRCYIFRGQKMAQATKDDSLVQQLVDAGQLDVAEARDHPRRNVITNAIGIFPPSEFRAAVTHVGPVLDIDRILLCSDGLHGFVSDEEIENAVHGSAGLASAADALVGLAKARGSNDNISVIVAIISQSAS